MATTRQRSVSFSVRPDFRALLACTDKFEGRCVGGIHIRFNAPVSRELAGNIRLLDEHGAVVPPVIEDGLHVHRMDYPRAFQDQATYRAELVAPITDVDGRALANASSFPATMQLGRLPPGASFGRGIRVVEREAGAVAPVLLRRVEEPLSGRSLRIAEDSEIVAWMRRVRREPPSEKDWWVGSASGRSDLPPSARLGWYTVDLEFNGKKQRVGDLRVERFRVGTMRAAILGPEGPLVNTGSVPITLSVEHLAGGGAASFPVSVRTTVRPWLYHWEHREPPEPRTASTTLDSKGTVQLDVPLPRLERKSLLDLEMDYQDANGQRKTASKRIEVWPAAIDLTVQAEDTRTMDKRILVKTVGLDGAAAPGVPVDATIGYPRYYDDVRLPGGFRGYTRRSESRLIATCSGHTDASGSLGCTLPPEAPNRVLVEATGRDENGNTTRTAETTGWSHAPFKTGSRSNRKGRSRWARPCPSPWTSRSRKRRCLLRYTARGFSPLSSSASRGRKPSSTYPYDTTTRPTSGSPCWRSAHASSPLFGSRRRSPWCRTLLAPSRCMEERRGRSSIGTSPCPLRTDLPTASAPWTWAWRSIRTSCP